MVSTHTHTLRLTYTSLHVHEHARKILYLPSLNVAAYLAVLCIVKCVFTNDMSDLL